MKLADLLMLRLRTFISERCYRWLPLFLFFFLFPFFFILCP